MPTAGLTFSRNGNLLSSQSESTLTQKYVLTELLDEVLHSDYTGGDLEDANTAVKLFTVITKGAFIPALEWNECENYDILLNSLKVIEKTALLNPYSLSYKIDGIPVYKYISVRCIPFFVYDDDKSIKTQVYSVLTKIWGLLISLPKYWGSGDDFKLMLMSYLQSIKSILTKQMPLAKSLAQSSLNQFTVPQPNVLRNVYIRRYTFLQVADLGLWLIRVIIASETDQALGSSLSLTNEDSKQITAIIDLVWSYLQEEGRISGGEAPRARPEHQGSDKSLNQVAPADQFERDQLTTRIHIGYLTICSKMLECSSTSSISILHLTSSSAFYPWLRKIAGWLDLFIKPMTIDWVAGSDLDLIVSEAILLAARQLCYSSEDVVAQFQSDVSALAMLSTDSVNQNTNVSLASIYMIAVISQQPFISKDTFESSVLESLRRDIHSAWSTRNYLKDPQRIYMDVFSVIGWSVDSMTALQATMSTGFDKLTDPVKLDVVNSIAMLAEALSGTDDADSTSSPSSSEGEARRIDYPGFEQLFTIVLTSSRFQLNLKLRLQTMICLRRVYKLINPETSLDITNNTPITSWLIASLKSTSRELRIAAVKLLTCFKSQDSDLQEKNINQIFKILSLFNFEVDSYLVETTITAWAEVGLICRGEKLNYVLIYLIRMLGSESSFRSSVAFCEIQRLAKSQKKTPWQLCLPFWPTISVMVIKEMRNVPTVLKRFSELLNIDQEEFIMRTAQYTVPYLVLARHYDTIELIATASNSSTKKIYLDYVPNIMAVLFTQDVEDPIAFAQQRWYAIDERFQEVGFSEVIGPNILELIFELLKLYQPNDDRKTKRIFGALAYLATIKHDISHNKGDEGLRESVALLLNENVVLQLVALFSETIRNLRGRSSYTTKLQCLSGISLMIQLSQDHFFNAVPQICTLLQSALEVEELQEYSLKAWTILIQHLKSKWINILTLTFSVVIQKWPDLIPTAREVASEMIREVCVGNTRSVQDYIRNQGIPPSFRSISCFSFVQKVIDECGKVVNRSPFDTLKDLLKRSDDENVYVVKQTLEDIRDLLLTKQRMIKSGFKNDDNFAVMRDLVYTLLSKAHAFRYNDETKISLICSQCIGLLGAIDHHVLDINPSFDEPVVINNFNGAKESIEFVMTLLSEFLVKTFRASIDPSLQMFLAFGIQEYLKFCGFTITSIKENHAIREYWNKFSYEDRSTLNSLLSTRYNAPQAPAVKLSYPIFSSTNSISYSKWLRLFTYDLMSKVTGVNALRIFGLCRRIVRDKVQHQGLFNFILPYVALNVVIGSSDEDRQNILNEILLILKTQSTPDHDHSAFHHSIFSLIDYFSKWTRSRGIWLSRSIAKSGSNIAAASRKIDDREITIVEDLLSKISPDILASRSFECKSYPRAVMYWEQLYRDPARADVYQRDDETLGKFEKIYFALDDPDAHAGVMSLFSETSIDMQLRQFENTGKWGQAMECYEALMTKNSTWDLATQTKVFHCLKEDGRFSDLLARLESSDHSSGDWTEMGIEVSWLTSNWGSLQKWLTKSTRDSYEVGVGNALLALRGKHKEELEYWISKARGHVTDVIQSITPNSLYQYSDSLVRLHALADLESISHLVFSEEPVEHMQVSSLLDNRLIVCGNNFATRRYLLALRRSAISISELPFAKQEVGLTWIASAKDARLQGQYTLALQCCLQALVSCDTISEKAYSEYSDLVWVQGDQRQAIQMIEPYIDSNFIKTGQFPMDKEISLEQAKIALKYTNRLDVSGQMDSESIISRYKGICRVASQWEDVYYNLAKYYNKLEDTQNMLPIYSRNSECLDGVYVKLMVTNYARSLQIGVKYSLESLPKMLTTWLNFAQSVIKPPTGTKGAAISASRRTESSVYMNQFLKKLIGKIPAYVFYMALPQLLSRIIINDPDVFAVLKSLVLDIASHYPRQSLWLVSGLYFSRNKERKEIGHNVIALLQKKLGSADQQELVTSGMNFIAELIFLCNIAPPERRATVSLADLEFNRKAFPCGLVVPIQSQMTVALPSEDESLENYNGFPNEPATIVEIEEEVYIQSSLQKPKRINVLASNGKRYKLLCKPKDDVRKDSRLMEVTNSVNRLLLKDDEAHKRHLKINTYYVTPLNEDCGVIEWVDGAMPLRSIINSLYQAKGFQINWIETKTLLSTNSEKQLLKNYLDVVAKHRPILYEWFIDTFPEPGNWLISRIKYARTCAAMSMIGYILGLGDRHGENLLLLQKSGELLHVDFDCLFDKGLSFEKPERVPFRLTHHMVDAMGITGYEGWYRRSCEVTLTLVRDSEDMMMNILEAFLHDPIVDWVKKRKNQNRKTINGLSAARSPEEALLSIKQKIKGIKGNDPVPLSVSGQVEYLIQQATSDYNLSHMYVGWAAFL